VVLVVDLELLVLEIRVMEAMVILKVATEGATRPVISILVGEVVRLRLMVLLPDRAEIEQVII
tara:strand:+ start:29 stop:217 length:189 start_codon:yes stop_codon:yes gene_type:complete